ncbi:MAG: polysaccharide pyruvyl transferase CsaB [Schwartzia sp.]|nr:polysaccharide pyruvyl transferase CsaB [Schwartzia sp. (in: firmicutes)]
MNHIVVSGYYGSKNAGDEAMLAAMIEVLSDLEPKLNITVISANPEDTEKRHGVAAVSWLDVGAIVSALKNADLMISGGGSLLQNVTSGRSLYYYLGVIFLARLLGKPVMLYAQGIGPVCGGFARWLMTAISSRVSLITVRDHGSLEELKSLSVSRPPIEVTADPVLAIHPVDRGIGRAVLKRYKADGAKPVIGISVREWRGWVGYKKAIAEAADRMAEELDARILFLPMQYPEDVEAAKQIASRMKSSAIMLDEEYTTSELLSIVGNLDLLISIRLHALIFAGVMNVPMVGISYDPKIDRFLDSIGQKPAADLKTVTADNLMEDVREKWKLRGEVQEKNTSLLAELRRLAFRNAELALDLMKNKK